MPGKKLNVNEASREDLLKIAGITPEVADLIITQRESGVILSVSDLMSNPAIPRNLSGVFTNNFSFVSSPGLGIAPSASLEIPLLGEQLILPTLPSAGNEISILTIYNFSLKIKRSDAAAERFDLYKVVVEYTLLGQRALRSRNNKEFNVNPDGSVNVSFSGVLGNPVININIYSPTRELVFSNTYNIDDIQEQSTPLAITITSLKTTRFDVQLKKTTGVDYPGFSLTTELEMKSSSSLVQRREFTQEVFGKDKVSIELNHVGDIQSIAFDLKNPKNESVLRKTLAVTTIPSSGFAFDLPKPSTFDFKIAVEIATAGENPFAGHFAVIQYDVKDWETGLVKRKEAYEVELDSEGEAEVDVNYFGLVEELLVDIKAPTGEIIGKRKVKTSSIGPNSTIKIDISPKKISDLNELPKLPVRPRKTVGRLIDALGQRKLDKVQVIFYGAKKDNPQDEDFFPIDIVVTEVDGYFTLETPQEPYTQVFARVGVANADGDPYDVPVRLEEGITTYNKLNENGKIEVVEEVHSYIPANIILVINTNEQDDEDGDCNCDCKELDFHQPKKVQEEYSYYSVVRTTEPQIKGYILEEDGEMTIQEVYETIPILNDPNLREPVNLPENFREQKVLKSVLLQHINGKNGVTLQTLNKALNASNAEKLKGKILPKKDVRALGRYELNASNPIDWDEDPTIYQATSLAHGHILHFKQEWMNDGYSIGDLLYSLPLAPAQKKQIVVYDWERREAASRTESLDYQEQLYNSLSRDRDINEIVSGSLSENTRGGSNAKSSGWSVAKGSSATGTYQGISFGSILSASGGSSKANSAAWQDSTRNSSMNGLQQLRDRTTQSANSVRSQRGTVIQTATQGERFSVETEFVANYNHCHSITIQYFEVLRHLKVQQRLADVQECLFVPLIMGSFDHQKILRWRETMSRYVRDPWLRRGFDAIERIENNYEGSDLPEGRFADESIDYLEGYIYLSFQFTKPANDPVNNGFLPASWAFVNKLHPSLFSPSEFFAMHMAGVTNQTEVFERHAAPGIAEAFVQHLRFSAVLDEGPGSNEQFAVIPVDATLVSRYASNQNLYVSLRVQSELPVIKRSAIKYIQIEGAKIGTNYASLAEILPAGSKVIVQSGEISYRTRHLSSFLFRNARIQNDLTNFDPVRIYTPLNADEMRNPRNEDIEVANALRDHLNDNLEFFHKAIWWNMSPERRFMFLDGIQVTDYSEIDKYPGGVVRSVASVVSNNVVGIIGNSLIMPVAPGFRLDPNMKGKEIDLFALYKPTTPPDPMHFSIPTKGVFAEAVMGKCNSCEKKEEERFWRWSEEPIPDNPTAIQPISTDSRKSDTPNLTPTAFPNPVISIQNAPAAPDPQGLSLVNDLLKTAAFANITGLEGNQQNAADALKQSFGVTQAIGEKAAELAALSAQLNSIKEANKSNILSNEKAQELTEDSLKKYSEKLGGDTGNAISNIKKVADMVKNGELPDEIGNQLSKKIIESMGGKPVLDKENSVLFNDAVQERIKSGDGVKYSGEGESIELDGGASKPEEDIDTSDVESLLGKSFSNYLNNNA